MDSESDCGNNEKLHGIHMRYHPELRAQYNICDPHFNEVIVALVGKYFLRKDTIGFEQFHAL